MNRLRCAIAIVCIVTSSLVHGEGVPYYDTSVEIKAIRPCKATVDRKLPCHAVLRAAGGIRFCLQSCGTTAQVQGFVEMLQEGHAYALPTAFRDYEKDHPDEAYVSYIESLKRSPWLTPEMCSNSSPESLFKARVSENPRRLDVNGSEASQDAFFRAYAGNLAAFTDQHYPLAAKVRKPLDDAFASVFEFISAVNGTNGGHYAARLPARVEWQIYSGFGSNFQTAPGRYSIDDLKTVAHIHQRAYGHDLFGPDNPDPFATHFEAGIKTLQGAEALMTEDAVIYFRAQMMAMFGEFLG